MTVAMLAVVIGATGVAADRLRAPDPTAVEQIRPDFEYVTVAPAAQPAPAKPPRVKPVQRASAPRVACPKLPWMPTGSATAAQAVVPRVKVFDRPDGRVVRTLTNPTVEGQRLHALVHKQDGFYLKIQLVARPNGATGWVRITDFQQYPAPYRIVVQRCAKKLTVFKKGKAVWSRTVAVGKPSTPTPTGDFFVDFITDMKCCAYGPFMLSVAGFSNVIFQFGKGGTGQIAIHGTNADWSVGKAASNGCVRMHNADITALARMVPPGTPVKIID
jgi:lipoprotein-anchoring transpeptidase ErfK/SrfK